MTSPQLLSGKKSGYEKFLLLVLWIKSRHTTWVNNHRFDKALTEDSKNICLEWGSLGMPYVHRFCDNKIELQEPALLSCVVLMYHTR